MSEHSIVPLKKFLCVGQVPLLYLIPLTTFKLNKTFLLTFIDDVSLSFWNRKKGILYWRINFTTQNRQFLIRSTHVLLKFQRGERSLMGMA